MGSNRGMNPSSLAPPLRRVASCAAILALGGCVALPPVYSYEHWKLSTDAPVTPTVTIVDERPPADFAPATYPYGMRVDPKMLSPAPVDYLAQEFSRAVQESPNRPRLEPLLAGRTITLRHFEIVATRSNVPTQVNPVSPLASALVWSVQSLANFNGEFWADIDVDVGDAHFTSHSTGKMRANPPEIAPSFPAAESVRALLYAIDAKFAVPAPVENAASGAAAQ